MWNTVFLTYKTTADHFASSNKRPQSAWMSIQIITPYSACHVGFLKELWIDILLKICYQGACSTICHDFFGSDHQLFQDNNQKPAAARSGENSTAAASRITQIASHWAPKAYFERLNLDRQSPAKSKTL